MKRLITLLLLVALVTLVALPVGAKPWYKDWKVWAVVGVSLGSSLALTHEAHECREQFSPAPCAGGYGEFKAREISRGVTSLGLVGIGLWGRHIGIKEWATPALGFATYNGIAAYRQTIVGCPSGEHFLYGTKFTCVDNYVEQTWRATRP
jgi:hypothetical protein